MSDELQRTRRESRERRQRGRTVEQVDPKCRETMCWKPFTIPLVWPTHIWDAGPFLRVPSLWSLSRAVCLFIRSRRRMECSRRHRAQFSLSTWLILFNVPGGRRTALRRSIVVRCPHRLDPLTCLGQASNRLHARGVSGTIVAADLRPGGVRWGRVVHGCVRIGFRSKLGRGRGHRGIPAGYMMK